jgi:hypothetical protein
LGRLSHSFLFSHAPKPAASKPLAHYLVFLLKIRWRTAPPDSSSERGITVTAEVYKIEHRFPGPSCSHVTRGFAVPVLLLRSNL